MKTKHKQSAPAAQPVDGRLAGLPEINLDGASPAPVGWLKIGSRRLPVLSVLDLPISDIQSMSAEEARVEREGSWLEKVNLARGHIQKVIPDITDGDLLGLTSRQLIQLRAQVVGVLVAAPTKTG